LTPIDPSRLTLDGQPCVKEPRYRAERRGGGMVTVVDYQHNVYGKAEIAHLVDSNHAEWLCAKLNEEDERE
jgi:hypothetical protein